MYWPYERNVIHGGGLVGIPEMQIDARLADVTGAFLPTPCLAGCLHKCVLEMIAEPGLYGIAFAGTNPHRVRQFHGSFLPHAEFGLLSWSNRRLTSVLLVHGRTFVREGQVYLQYGGRWERIALPDAYCALMAFIHLGEHEPLYVPGTIGARYCEEVLMPMSERNAYAPPDRYATAA